MLRLLSIILLAAFFVPWQAARSSELQVSVAYAYQRARSTPEVTPAVVATEPVARPKNVFIGGTWYTQQTDGTLTVCQSCNVAQSRPETDQSETVYQSAGFCGSRARSGGACGLLSVPFKILAFPFRLFGCR